MNNVLKLVGLYNGLKTCLALRSDHQAHQIPILCLLVTNLIPLCNFSCQFNVFCMFICSSLVLNLIYTDNNIGCLSITDFVWLK